MDLNAEVAVLEGNRRTLTRWGIWGTALYLGCLLGYGAIAWQDFATLSPNEVGDFLAGAFAPLAFLWLVLGYRMQALELEQNSKALRQQAEEMRNAVEQAAAQTVSLQSSELYNRQNVLNQTRDRYEIDLGFASSKLVYPFLGMVSNLDWYDRRFKEGYRDTYAELISSKIKNKEALGRLSETIAVGSPVENHLHRYINLYRDFMRTLSLISLNDDIIDYYKRGAFDRLFVYSIEALNRASKDMLPLTENERA